jgi:hypothetical protein
MQAVKQMRAASIRGQDEGLWLLLITGGMARLQGEHCLTAPRRAPTAEEAPHELP